MRRAIFCKRLLSGILCLLLTCNNVLALNAVTDLIEHTSGVNPTTIGSITNITTTHNIDTYHWSSFNLAGHETANFIFGANGQTAINYLSPGANPSAIYGAITGSGATGNILLFNPNGIMMGGGTSISGANTFLASTNKFDGIVNGKVTFSEAATNNPLTLGNIQFNNVNNAHFIAPNVAVNADNLTTSNTISFRAIGGGEYDVDTNLLSNEIGVKNPIAKMNILDVNANIKSNKITVEAKADSETYAEAMVSGEIKANKAVTGENGEIYIVASNANTSPTAGAQIVQNAIITGDSATVALNSDRICLNGNIDTSGVNGGTVSINTKSLDQNGNISAKGTTGDGGNVDISAMRYVAVKGTKTDASGVTKGGNINIEGGYQILSSGSYDASSSVGSGGNIKISAPLTKLFGADINASGYSAGGNVYIGGPGTSSETVTDSYLTLLSDACLVDASSTAGKGGNVYVDSKNTTYVFGSINTGGYENNGGYIELSGKEYLGFNDAKINVGKGGTIYLDPKNIIIDDSTIVTIGYNTLLENGSTILPAPLVLNNFDYFGSSIALYNNLLAIGAKGDDTGKIDAGAVYLFGFDAGSLYKNLTLYNKLADGSVIGSGTLSLNAGDKFGSAVALYGTSLAVGASGTSSGGEVYLFSFNGNFQSINKEYELTSAGGWLLSSFGDSVSLYNDLLAVSDTGYDSDSGAVYLYDLIGYVPYYNSQLTLGIPSTHFGSSLAVNGSLFAIGCAQDLDGGKVYLFETGSGWPLTYLMTLENGYTKDGLTLNLAAGDNFGSSVAAYDKLLAVGASGSDGGLGAVYLFNSNDTTFATPNIGPRLANGSPIINASGIDSTLSLSAGDNFGSSVALYNNLLPVGASGHNTSSGGAYLFSIANQQVGAYLFEDYPAATIHLSSTKLATWLASSDLILQANNDITFLNSIAVTGGAGNTLTLQAGRNIEIASGLSIDLGSANLVATANEILAAGVIDAYRDAGAAEINMAVGSSIKTLGDMSLIMETGAGKTYSTSGDIILNNVTGNNIFINNKGVTAGSDININGTLTATGLATLTAMDILMANPSTAYGGFNILAIGNVTTDDLITTDGTLIHPGANVVIEAYSPTTPVPDTFITTKNITAGIGNIDISLSQYLSSDVGTITINGDMSGNFIKLLNAGSTGYSNIVVNGTITATASGADPQRGIVELNAQDDITVNSPAFADTGFDIYGAFIKTNDLTTNNYVNISGYDIDVAGAIDAKGSAILAANDIKIEADSTANTGFQLLANHSVKTENLTTVNSDVEIQGNLGTVSVPPSTIDVGNITAGTGDVTITMFDNLPVPGAITLKDITAKNIDVENKGASASSVVLINGTLTATVDAILKATGDITQSTSSGGIIIAGTTDLKSGSANNIKLEKITNDFVGAVTIEGANNASLRDANSFIFGPVTNNGNLTVYANNRTTAGATANISMDPGATIISGGNVDIRLLDNPDAGTISVNSIDGNKISVWNQSLLAGTDVLINSGATLSSHSLIDTNPLIVSSDGGNFLNNAGVGSLSVASDRWLVYTGSPADTTLGGLIPVNTFYSSTIYNHPPGTVIAGDSVLYRTPGSTPTPSGGGGGNGGVIAGATVGGIAATGAAVSSAGFLLPGLLLGLASPIQFDECMLDVIDQNSQAYPLLVRNMQYVYQTCDISKLDPCKIGSTKFIPDLDINNGSYQVVKVQIPPQFANAPKGVTVKITQKSYPFGISKNIPDMNFNIFNTLNDKQINSMYQTRRFLKSNYLSKRITPLQANSNIEAANGIIQKTVFVSPNEIGNNLSIAVNYLKNGQFPRKNSTLKFDKQSYSLVVQFIENK